MNRTNAIKKVYEIAKMPNDDTTLKELIDEIYDDFDAYLKDLEYLKEENAVLVKENLLLAKRLSKQEDIKQLNN